MATPTDIDTSDIDFYDFLSLAGPGVTASEINRAGRKTSRLYHPDKVEATPENLRNFHVVQIAIGVLGDPEQKRKYDQTREAKRRRKTEVDAMDARRRQMIDDLENRERSARYPGNDVPGVAGQKRTFDQREQQREMKMKRIQEENARKIEALKTQRTFDAEQKAAEERATRTKAEDRVANGANGTNGHAAQYGDDKNARSLMLRWVREGKGLEYYEPEIEEMFPSSAIEVVMMLKDRKRKLEGRDKKVMVGTACVVFNSVHAAKKAMADKANLTGLESVEWVPSTDEAPSAETNGTSAADRATK